MQRLVAAGHFVLFMYNSVVTATENLKYPDVITSVDNWSLVWKRAVLPTVQKYFTILTAVNAFGGMYWG
jgi:hypothetical protein